MSATDDLLAFAGRAHSLPAATRANAERLLADTLAVAAAGVGAPGEAAILSVASTFGSGSEARLYGSGERMPAASAAFVNGYRIHCLEWDAVHEPAVVHAMSVVTAALGAAIDRRGGCDPIEALTALAVGVDIAAGLGLAADSGLTFFRPATAGVIGAALAVARFDGAPLDNALGLAYSSAAGTMQAHVEGLETLPFQIANAARAAVIAADLAKAGFSGPKEALNGAYGYFTLFEKGDLARYTDTIGAWWQIDAVSVKPFPCGRASHAALGCLQSLAPEPTEVERIELACPPLIRRLVDRPYRPTMTPAYARLCLPLLAALMLRDGRIDPRRFTSEQMREADLADLAARIALVEDGSADPNALFPQELRVTLRGGGTQRHLIDHTLGSPENPLTPACAAAKTALARELAGPEADPVLFDDPLSYYTKAR